jgi:hypothetical protein
MNNESPATKYQRTLDFYWQLQLEERVARNAPRPGDYDPMARFDREQDELAERQDQAFRRRSSTRA